MHLDRRVSPHARCRTRLCLVAVVVGALACRADVAVGPASLSPRGAALEAAPPPSGPPPAVQTTTLPGAQVGQPYRATISASSANRPLRFAVTAGSLPAGLTLDPNTGVISGTPTTKGFSGGIVVTVTDGRGQTTSTKPLAIDVDDPHFGIYILGPTGPAPGAADRSGEKRTITMRLQYIRNGVVVTQSVTLDVPANATPAQILTAILPAVQRALGADFDISLVTGAASPRIELVAKPGVTLGSNRPSLTVGAAIPATVVPIGRLRISAALPNAP